MNFATLPGWPYLIPADEIRIKVLGTNRANQTKRLTRRSIITDTPLALAEPFIAGQSLRHDIEAFYCSFGEISPNRSAL